MNKAAALLGGSIGSFGLFVIYDYQTCHPMRKNSGPNGYNVGGSFVRLHNIIAKTVAPQMSLVELSAYNGTYGKPTYFSSNGLIYDVSSSDMFQSSYSLWKGKDATVALAKMSLDPADINRTDWDSLSENDIKSLQSWSHYFSEKYFIKGRVAEFVNNPKK
mmetsp:Transcript_18366/g.28360  ORF Transcript_18366/g.28360 Transcript_18366/m.28360 type:complete len:161 (-) Transcript_18366:135-617(-)|eukprot:CAMPEP_0195294454 /NCGR_PEP_ID=MMETSP0707-20130614/15035_1 /TAXON_ID=33640 /ORGANISM="Asterionellopsis glacialis, Strain CCMP134" /LENGTH=160 /DNA_ID=CAMNT_0040355435 /DNA_START=242 /DNA_END=724 /DNA_ORIENTATION=+